MRESIFSWYSTYSSIKSMYNSDLLTVLIKSTAARMLQHSPYPSAAYRQSQTTLGKITELHDGAMNTREARMICLPNYFLNTAINKGASRI